MGAGRLYELWGAWTVGIGRGFAELTRGCENGARKSFTGGCGAVGRLACCDEISSLVPGRWVR